MTETTASSLPALTETARALARMLESGEGAFAGVLLEALKGMEVGVAIKDMSTGCNVFVNDAMAHLLGRTPKEMIGARDAEWFSAGQLSALRAAEQASLGQFAALVTEHRLDLSGQQRDFSVVRVAVPRADGAAPRHVCSAWVELSAARQREAQLQRALAQLEQQQVAVEALRRETHDSALRDSVTGLYQRGQFDEQLRREVDLSAREHREFALVSIALDPPGDEASPAGIGARTRVLEALGRLLRSNTRAMDASCRVDDGYFAVLLSGVGLATAHSRMEGLRRQCATQIVVYEGRDFGFTVSMGVASFPHTAQTQEELLQASDKALAEAQKRGGNSVALASIRFEET